MDVILTSMRLLVLSDLHLELWGERALSFDICISKPDMVILAGDIHTRSRAPAWADESFPGLPVLYIAGNHEYYGEAIDKAGDTIARECDKQKNVHYLDCGEYISKGVRFLGATLWTDFSLFGPDCKFRVVSQSHQQMTDYQRIKVAAQGYKKLQPQDTARLHEKHKTWLKSKLEQPFAGHTVVVTHMAPSMRSITTEYAADPLAGAFASNLDDLVAKADLWIHGHTHSSFDYRIKQCRVVANPLGYRMRDGRPENENFDPNFVVKLENF
jgi:predicted phosphodiesterase